MSDPPNSVLDILTSALQDHLQDAEELALMRAYEAGRGAVEEGRGLLEVVGAHRDALRQVISQAETVDACIKVADASAALLAEGMGAFEMAHRAFRETNQELNQLNRSLEDQIAVRLRTEGELHLAREEAEEANQAKSEFLSRMSHELRTPLNAILGFGQLLEIEDLSDEDQESVGLILSAGRHLLDLVNEVLDIARIEAGRLALSIEPVERGRSAPGGCGPGEAPGLGPGHRLHREARGPGRALRQRGPPASEAGPAEPGGQWHQVQPRWWVRRARRAGGRRRRHPARRQRHRPRNPGGEDEPALLPLRSARRGADQRGGNRPRPCALEATRGGDGRYHRRRELRGPGEHLLGRAAPGHARGNGSESGGERSSPR